jgi:uncharacterized phage protein (TIGR01671 family)
MNRTIKFRAWDKDNKKFATETSENFNGEILLDLNGKVRVAHYPVGNGDNSADSVFEPLNNQDNYIIQQFTGLKDRYSKEIYEGDLVRDKYGALYEVCWIDTEASFEFAIRNENDNIDYDFARCSALGISFSKVEVIGNVFENYELIK